jgi:hypothetical protein
MEDGLESCNTSARWVWRQLTTPGQQRQFQVGSEAKTGGKTSKVLETFEV